MLRSQVLGFTGVSQGLASEHREFGILMAA